VSKKARARAMPCSRIFGASIFVAVAIVAAPTYVSSQPRTDKVEKDEAAAHDATPGSSGSWLTASDKDITRQVEGRLSKDARLKWVDVRTNRGAVVLTGAVPSIGASTRASELARGVPGVRSVRNELAYEPGPMDDVGGPKTTSVLKESQSTELGIAR
jgi:hyperosmotically inducible periplasmic protein